MNDFEKNFDVETFEDYSIDRDTLLEIVNNRVYNKKIIDYYQNYLMNPERKHLLGHHKLKNIEDCNKFFLVDIYEHEMVKDIRKTNLCKDKFCNNCKKVKQASRMSRYIPFIESYRDYCYHLVLTVPNVSSERLESTIEVMNDSFKKLVGYFSGHKKISDVDFKKYGFLGAIKSLEISFKGDTYHPHFHVLLCLKSRGVEDRIYSNKYSYSTSNGFRKFTELEILIQKVWFLLNVGMIVNKENIDEVELGFSCTLDKFQNDDYIELFKYLTKDFDDSKNILTYDNFKVILDSTFRLKQIQGYGCFYRLIDEDLDEELEKEYENVVYWLKLLETPIQKYEKARDLVNDPYTLISRKTIFQFIQNKKQDN